MSHNIKSFNEIRFYTKIYYRKSVNLCDTQRPMQNLRLQNLVFMRIQNARMNLAKSFFVRFRELTFLIIIVVLELTFSYYYFICHLLTHFDIDRFKFPSLS